YGGGHGHKVTMNDLPVPQGDWKLTLENSKFNALVAGIAVLAGTIGFVKTSGVIQFNYSPPKSLD
uniref:Deltamethrin resistance protein prag01 domain-containing protein n=1 Tax=Megaselia scalaris TaxID=36166 RepID=T1H7H8_MEGSC